MRRYRTGLFRVVKTRSPCLACIQLDACTSSFRRSPSSHSQQTPFPNSYMEQCKRPIPPCRPPSRSQKLTTRDNERTSFASNRPVCCLDRTSASAGESQEISKMGFPGSRHVGPETPTSSVQSICSLKRPCCCFPDNKWHHLIPRGLQRLHFRKTAAHQTQTRKTRADDANEMLGCVEHGS